MNILFLCTGNSCRSILAEATFNHLAPTGWKAMSAGSQPTGTVHPRSLSLLTHEGIDTGELHSKSWDNLPLAPDVVITVCANAAGETCRSEEHTSELQSLMRRSYAVFCLKNKNTDALIHNNTIK